MGGTTADSFPLAIMLGGVACGYIQQPTLNMQKKPTQ